MIDCLVLQTVSEHIIKAVLFDLDGVLVATDHLHYQAWSALAQRECIPFDDEINQHLRGVSRRHSLEIMLQGIDRSYSESEIREMLEFKNALYCSFLETLTPSAVSPDVWVLLDELNRQSILSAVVSASCNARVVLKETGLIDAFDLVVDGCDVTRSKPDPQGFLLAAERLNVSPADCLVVEDAPAGVEAAHRAGMHVVIHQYERIGVTRCIR